MEDLDWRDCQELCLTGDQAACARLFKRHEREVARQMWRFSRDRGVCEELVQEAFVQAYFSLAKYRRMQTPFIHWLRRIATRVGYRYWKQQSRRRGQISLEGFDFAAAQSTDPSVAASLLHELLSRLAVADRLVLTLMYFEQCSVEQIADRTGWNRAMVKMRAYRARRRLKLIIDDEGLLEQLQDVNHGST